MDIQSQINDINSRLGEIEKSQQKTGDYLFTQNYEQQTDIFENVLSKLETGNGIGIGKRLSQDNAALLEVTSIKKGIRSSRMTTAQRDTITNPGEGLIIFNLTTNTYNYYNGITWVDWSFSTSGTYTPTLTGVTNVTTLTPQICNYTRDGNIVSVSGTVVVVPTANNTRTTFRMSLPIASDFTTIYQAGGSGASTANTTAGHPVGITSDATNNQAVFDYYETHGGGDTFSFIFQYIII